MKKNLLSLNTIVWILIIIFMLIGLTAAYYYKGILSYYENVEICECIEIRDVLILQLQEKIGFIGRYMIDIALAGFSIGVILSVLTLVGSLKTGYLFTISSTAVSALLIPILILIEIETGIICEYCTVMQVSVVSSTILSLLWLTNIREK